MTTSERIKETERKLDERRAELEDDLARYETGSLAQRDRLAVVIRAHRRQIAHYLLVLGSLHRAEHISG